MSVQPNPYLEICFCPTIATVNEARRLVAALYGPLLDDQQVGARITLAVHGLLENALEDSLDGTTVMRVELSRGARARAHEGRTGRNAASTLPECRSAEVTL